MIVVVGGIKGGSGKTTLATNFVVLRSLGDAKVLLVDADEQKTATDWVEQREGSGFETNWSTVQLSGKTVCSQLMKLGPDYDDIIVDVGGRDTTSQRSALTVADVFIIPFKPRSADIWTIDQVSTMIVEIKTVNPQLICLAVVNQADAKGSDNEEAVEILKECTDLICAPFSIGNRKAFGNAMTEGVGVIELKSQDKKASTEIKELCSYVYKTYQ